MCFLCLTVFFFKHYMLFFKMMPNLRQKAGTTPVPSCFICLGHSQERMRISPMGGPSRSQVQRWPGPAGLGTGSSASSRLAGALQLATAGRDAWRG